MTPFTVWGGLLRGPYGTGAIYCAFCNIVPPSTISAMASGNNQVTVVWSPVPGATSYNVYRKYMLCGKSIAEKIATGVTDTSFVDTQAQASILYQYNITSIAGCESLPNSVPASATTTGDCSLTTCFNGIKSVKNNYLNSCSMTLSWEPAVSTCPNYANITYSIYKSIEPDFIPSSSNLLADCINDTSFTDIDVAAGIPFYYIVRAKDNSARHSGSCNGGNTDSNQKKEYNYPTGAINTTLFTDDFESGMSNWNISAGWSQSSIQKNIGNYSAYSGNLNMQFCDTITNTTAVSLPTTGIPQLHFWN